MKVQFLVLALSGLLRSRESQRKSKVKTEGKKKGIRMCRFLFGHKTRKIIITANSVITCARHSSELSLYMKQVTIFSAFYR